MYICIYLIPYNVKIQRDSKMIESLYVYYELLTWLMLYYYMYKQKYYIIPGICHCFVTFNNQYICSCKYDMPMSDGYTTSIAYMLNYRICQYVMVFYVNTVKSQYKKPPMTQW